MDRAQALTEQFIGELPDEVQEQSHFMQSLEEVAHHVLPVEKARSDHASARVLRRLSTPDRILTFRVTWEDDAGRVQVNRGWRIQNSNAIGPYKGGLRFHPSVTQDILHFLAFEQCFKNALTMLPLGGAKGGSDFDPKSKSTAEIMRFCQAFMRELAPFIGPDRDVPAGDINVGAREIGWLFGAWRNRSGTHEGALTGKGLSYGGSQVRVEATGYGLIYFVMAMLARRDMTIEGRRVAISGMGNVALHAAEKAIEEGACVTALSNSSGRIVAKDGLTHEALDWICMQRSAGEDVATPPARLGLRFEEGAAPWDLGAEIALPCATQNEMDRNMAQDLVDGGAQFLAEGANMPLTSQALAVIAQSEIEYAPGKASNAGGVAVSGLEMSQNSHRRAMSAERVDAALKDIMSDIHARVATEGHLSADRVDYVRGANVAGYRRLADAITAQGII